MSPESQDSSTSDDLCEFCLSYASTRKHCEHPTHRPLGETPSPRHLCSGLGGTSHRLAAPIRILVTGCFASYLLSLNQTEVCISRTAAGASISLEH